MSFIGQCEHSQRGVGDADGIAMEVLEGGFPVQVESRIRVRRRDWQVRLEKGEDLGGTDAFRFPVLPEDGGVLAFVNLATSTLLFSLSNLT